MQEVLDPELYPRKLVVRVAEVMVIQVAEQRERHRKVMLVGRVLTTVLVAEVALARLVLMRFHQVVGQGVLAYQTV
mgnify:CR=1 FL=1